MDHSFQFAATILIACSLTIVVPFDLCNDCPVAIGSGCQCQNVCEEIGCDPYYDDDIFPKFQTTAATLNITSITIRWYHFKEIPSYAFNMGTNVTVKQITLFYIDTLERIQANAFSGLTSLQTLTLSFLNLLRTFDSMSFSGLNLSELIIENCGLPEFPKDSLIQILGLRSLVFNGHNISSLQNGTFSGLSTVLDYLVLSFNRISNISANAFIGLPSLTTLDLSVNSISTIHYGTFAALKSLSILDLSYNSIATIHSETFANLKVLSRLNLQYNPITMIDAHAFNGTDFLKLSSLSLMVSNATVIEPEAFDVLPELKEIIIRLSANDFSKGKCVKSISISCQLFPQLQHIVFYGAVCADILQPLSPCIKMLSISSINAVAILSEPLCLNQVGNLTNLQELTLRNLQSMISFNLMALKGLYSLYEIQDLFTRPTSICDEALASTPYLTSLSLQQRDYIPKAVEKMEKLVNLTLPGSTKIICNCSSYWLYNFTTSHGIDISKWKCVNESEYGNVTQFLEEMHTSGACQGSQPDFQEQDWDTCSKLCPSAETTAPTMTFTISTKPIQISTSPHSGTSSSTQKANHSNKTILYSVLGTLAFVFLLSSGVGYYWYKRFRRLRRVKVEQCALQIHEETLDHWEVPRSFLQLSDEKLGSGAFGVVVKAKCLAEPPEVIPSTVKAVPESAEVGGIVAVKRLPPHANSAAKYQFLQEIETMKSLGQHRHLVSIIACITMSEPVCLIVDYCSDGDLLRFLKARKPSSDNPEEKSLSLNDQLSFAWQVADGMFFLSSKGYAHRDLAARNVLIHNSNIAKVSDFGLCRLTDEDTASYVTRGGPLPLRWLAPECIQDYKFSIASDVWAFGILLFEIISLGSTPYEGMHLSEIESFLAQGKRMSQLEGCTDNLYQMMLQCWEEVPGDRPGFPELRDQLMEMLEKEANESFDYLTLIPETSGVAEE